VDEKQNIYFYSPRSTKQEITEFEAYNRPAIGCTRADGMNTFRNREVHRFVFPSLHPDWLWGVYQERVILTGREGQRLKLLATRFQYWSPESVEAPHYIPSWQMVYIRGGGETSTLPLALHWNAAWRVFVRRSQCGYHQQISFAWHTRRALKVKHKRYRSWRLCDFRLQTAEVASLSPALRMGQFPFLTVVYLFNDAVSSSDNKGSNGRIIDEWTGKHVEGSNRGLTSWTKPAFTSRNWGKPRSTSDRTAGLQAAIWTRAHPNMKQECYLPTVTFCVLSRVPCHDRDIAISGSPHRMR
jgi:hypothetical protein